MFRHGVLAGDAASGYLTNTIRQPMNVLTGAGKRSQAVLLSLEVA